MRPSIFCISCVLALASCTTDASLTKDVTGTWSWKPNRQLPPEKVRKEGFVTPDVESVKFGADGTFVLVQQLPGYDADVAGTRVPVPELWMECHGTWSVTKGQLTVEESEGERWVAARRGSKWVTEPTSMHSCRMFSYTFVTHEKHRMELKAVAIGDYDRSFERLNEAMPERPALAP